MEFKNIFNSLSCIVIKTSFNMVLLFMYLFIHLDMYSTIHSLNHSFNNVYVVQAMTLTCRLGVCVVVFVFGVGVFGKEGLWYECRYVACVSA